MLADRDQYHQTSRSSLSENEVCFRELGHLVTVPEELERNRSAIQPPDAAANSHDAGLGGELHARIEWQDILDSFGEDLVDNVFIDAQKVSDATSAIIMPELI